jgi:hypothetical protein
MSAAVTVGSLARALKANRVDYKVVAFKETIFVLGVAHECLIFMGHGHSVEEALHDFCMKLGTSFMLGKRVEK